MTFWEAFKKSHSLSSLICFSFIMTFLAIIDSHRDSYIFFDNYFGIFLFWVVVLFASMAGWGFLYSLILAITKVHWPDWYRREMEAL
jgi:uncharacterized membrane protein YedE/YeeE